MKNLFYTFLSFLFFISFQNPNLKDLKKEKFISDLISKMTIEEKAGQMNQYNGFWDATGQMPEGCLLYTSPSPRDLSTSRMPSSA